MYYADQQVISGEEHYFTVQVRHGRINRKLSGKYGNTEMYETITHAYKNTATIFLEGSSSICTSTRAPTHRIQGDFGLLIQKLG